MTNKTSNHCHTIDESICEMTGVKVENHITDERSYFQSKKWLVPKQTIPLKSKIMIGNGNTVEFQGVRKNG
ncbi:hypothetical protein [Francisella marina]|uniref:Uncharacterized protein n=1 Tax=Francisella marina TaxID=2249302 RepID=A0ABX5ZH95_9GAMM|nr:hypothetical protein [Francisella marina]QEO57580.1 hypothetical protein F0R74_06830 [Francisella marina]